MNKGTFIKAFAENAGLTNKDANDVYAAFVETVTEGLKAEGKIQLVGFGTWILQDKPAREAFNPLTGKKVKVAASKAPKFKVGKSYKGLFN